MAMFRETSRQNRTFKGKQMDVLVRRILCGETLRKVATRIDVTPERVRQIEAKVEEKLRFRLRKKNPGTGAGVRRG